MKNMLYFELFNMAVFWLLRLGVLAALVTAAVLAIRALRNKHSQPPEPAAPAPSKTLAQALKDHRTRCKLTQEYVADALGVSRQAVSKWETGESEPTMSNLSALAKTYGVTLAQLLQDVR